LHKSHENLFPQNLSSTFTLVKQKKHGEFHGASHETHFHRCGFTGASLKPAFAFTGTRASIRKPFALTVSITTGTMRAFIIIMQPTPYEEHRGMHCRVSVIFFQIVNNGINDLPRGLFRCAAKNSKLAFSTCFPVALSMKKQIVH
jgi:hypothetical protein